MESNKSLNSSSPNHHFSFSLCLSPGDVNGIEITPVQQAQFIPLTEVLCLIISEMNKRKLMANQETIRSKLGECYNKMPIPSPEIIHKSLTHLLNERKVEHNGMGYFIIGMEKVSHDSSDVETDDSGSEYSARLKKPREERGYLMFKDGQLTKHDLPTFMIDKGTQTAFNKGQVNTVHVAQRPVSFLTNPNKNPTNNGMQTIYEREPTSVGQSPQTTPERNAASAFQRSLSMREKRNSPAKKNTFDRTSSMRVKMDIEPGYLTSDSDIKPSCFGKLLGKSPKKSAARASVRRPNENLQTFAAQFPPSDVHDPFFNYAHFEDKIETPKVVASNGSGKFKERIIEGAGNTAVVKEKKKKDGPLPKDSKSRVTQQYKVDHGKLTHTAESLAQKYKNAADESMPESEAEFVRPSFEGKFRTKAVADQCKPAAAPKKKVLSVHSDKIKHYFSTIRDTKPQHVKPFQGISTDCETDSQCTEQMGDLPPGLDLPGGRGSAYQEEGQYCALPSESESESVGVPSMIRKFVATSRHINETFSARRQASPAASKQVRSDNTSSNGSSSVRERPLGLSPNQPYPEQNGVNNQHNGLPGNSDFYQEGEIDDLMRREVNHNSSPSGHLRSPNHATRPFSAAYAELQYKQPIDSRLAKSNHNIHNCVPNGDERYNQIQNGESDSRGSRSLPTTPMHEASPPIKQVVVHQRIESISSSTADSGFNSPRSSLSQGHNNNNMAFDLINDRQNNGMTEAAKVKRHSLGNILGNDNELKMVKSPSSHSTHSTGSDNTVKSQVERRKKQQRSNTNLNRIPSLDVIGTL